MLGAFSRYCGLNVSYGLNTLHSGTKHALIGDSPAVIDILGMVSHSLLLLTWRTSDLFCYVRTLPSVVHNLIEQVQHEIDSIRDSYIKRADVSFAHPQNSMILMLFCWQGFLILFDVGEPKSLEDVGHLLAEIRKLREPYLDMPFLLVGAKSDRSGGKNGIKKRGTNDCATSAHNILGCHGKEGSCSTLQLPPLLGVFLPDE